MQTKPPQHPISQTARHAPHLLNIHLLHLDIPSIPLRDRHNQHPVLHLRAHAVLVHHRRRRPAAQPHLPLKHAHLPLVQRQRFEELLIAGAIDDARDRQLRLVGVPVDADVLLLGAGEGDVDDVVFIRVKDVCGRGEVLRSAVVLVFVVGLVARGVEVRGEELGDLVQVEVAAQSLPAGEWTSSETTSAA